MDNKVTVKNTVKELKELCDSYTKDDITIEEFKNKLNDMIALNMHTFNNSAVQKHIGLKRYLLVNSIVGDQNQRYINSLKQEVIQ